MWRDGEKNTFFERCQWKCNFFFKICALTSCKTFSNPSLTVYMVFSYKVIFSLVFYLFICNMHFIAFFFFFLEHQWVFESSVIVANESLGCPWCEKMDLKIIVIVGKVSNTQKCWKTKTYCGTWRILHLKNIRQFNCSGQTRDSWTTITKKTKTKNSRGSFS